MEKKVDVLYAEDDPRMAELVKDALEEHEFLVRVVPDGRVAWEVLRSTPPDMLLLDLEMPGKNGLELVRFAHEVNLSMPIVFYSSYMNIQDELEAHLLGAAVSWATGKSKALKNEIEDLRDEISTHEETIHGKAILSVVSVSCCLKQMTFSARL